jgi:hypothetical protein
MSRPVGAVAAEPLQEDVECAVAFVPIGVEREPRARHDTEVVAVSRTLRESQHALFRHDHLCPQHFALGHQVLDREHEFVVALPGLLRQESAAGSEVLECGVVCGR